MKADELMLGDWVKTPNGLKTVKQNFGEDGIYTRLAPEYYEPEGFDESEIEPIPLTPEILKKNGFGDEEMSDDYYGGEIQIDLSLDEWTHEEESGAIISGYGKKIKYVHELQHALRLCGIEKEIVL